MDNIVTCYLVSEKPKSKTQKVSDGVMYSISFIAFTVVMVPEILPIVGSFLGTISRKSSKLFRKSEQECSSPKREGLNGHTVK